MSYVAVILEHKNSNKHDVCRLSDIFTQKDLQAPIVFQQEKSTLLICFKNCLQCSAICYFSLWIFVTKENVQFL